MNLVRDWTTRDLISAEPTMKLDDAMRLLEQNDIRHLPIIENGTYLGIVSRTALRRAQLVARYDPSKRHVKLSELIDNREQISGTATMADAARKLLTTQVTSLAVLDEAGRLDSILTQSDMLYHTLLAENPPPSPELVTLKDGVEVVIRPIHLRDAAELNDLYEALSYRSKYMRFHSGNNPFTIHKIRRFTLADYQDHMAYVVVDPNSDKLAGVVEYVPLTPPVDGSAEFSIAIADAWQGKGLGRILMTMLIEYARTQKICRILGIIHAENAAMRYLTKHLGVPTTQSFNGSAYEVWLEVC